MTIPSIITRRNVKAVMRRITADKFFTLSPNPILAAYDSKAWYRRKVRLEFPASQLDRYRHAQLVSTADSYYTTRERKVGFILPLYLAVFTLAWSEVRGTIFTIRKPRKGCRR